MFLLKSNFLKDLIILLSVTILLGTALVLAGGYITDNYFSQMVSGIIGEYGVYDFLFTLARDKEEMALSQIKNVINTSLPGIEIKAGPEIAGSSNYLIKLPEEYKNEQIYTSINRYFDGIPGLMGINIITEPRLIVRGFRGDSLQIVRPLLDNIKGVDFSYKIGDGVDIVLEDPEQISDVKKAVNKILGEYKIFEVRYPLQQHPEDTQQLKNQILSLINEYEVTEVKDVTSDTESSRASLLKSLKEMKDFLVSYASKIVIKDVENIEEVSIGSDLIIHGDEEDVLLEVIDNSNDTLTALIRQGNIENISQPGVYLRRNDKYLGEGEVVNPRQDLAEALARLNEITPQLNVFLDQSEQLLEYSDRINTDLDTINSGIDQLSETSSKINESLSLWKEEDLSLFLNDIVRILDEIKANVGDMGEVQSELIKTSNNLKEGAGMIEEKIIFIPRGNSLYQELNQLKEIFLKLSSLLDDNYDLVSEQTQNMAPLLSSIDESKNKINHLLDMESTLSSGVQLESIGTILDNVRETAEVINTKELQDKLKSIQNLLTEIKTTQLPVILEQLTYIQNSLPELKESEIIETINLIDSYIAGEVIPGDQIQLLIKGEYDKTTFVDKVKSLIANPAVTYISMDAAVLQDNPRGEIFNILRQIRAVISTLIALVFTLFVMIMDQSLIVSILKLNGSRGFIYSFVSGSLIFSLIYLLGGVNFPYFNLYTNILAGGLLGLLIGLFSGMLNPVNREEWEAGKALGFSVAEIMHEIIIPSGKPGLLYLLNYPRITFR